jgi:signal peptidase II
VRTSKLRWWAYLLVGIALIVADQCTKYLITARLSYGESMQIIPGYLDFTLAHNRGAAFSFLQNSAWAHWFFMSIGLVAAFAIPIWLRRLDQRQWLLASALGLVWSGAIGNMIDRVRFRYVVDFIAVHWHDAWRFAIFNVADSAITVGAVLLIIYELFFARKYEKSNN